MATLNFVKTEPDVIYHRRCLKPFAPLGKICKVYYCSLTKYYVWSTTEIPESLITTLGLELVLEKVLQKNPLKVV